MRKNILNVIILGIFTIGLFSCSGSSPKTSKLTLKIQSSDPNSFVIGQPAEAALFDCLFVNVVGDGIDSKDSNLIPADLLPNLLNGTSTCSYPGVVSDPVTLDGSTTSITISLNVPNGQNRLIQVIGVILGSGVTCGNMDTSTFVETAPDKFQLIEIGQTKTDTTAPTTVTITNSYNESTPKVVDCTDNVNLREGGDILGLTGNTYQTACLNLFSPGLGSNYSDASGQLHGSLNDAGIDNVLVKLDFTSNTNVNIHIENYINTPCNALNFHSTFKYDNVSYSVGEAGALALITGFLDFDLVFNGTTVRPETGRSVALESFCGLTGLSDNVDNPVTDTSTIDDCIFPGVGEQRFEGIQISGNNLSFGHTVPIGELNEANRPTSALSETFTKQ